MEQITHEEKPSADPGRRNFLRALMGAAGAAAALQVLDKLEAAPEQVAGSLVRVPQAVADADDQADVLIRMQADLARALKKQPSERRWVMVIDLRKCVGCHACTIACVAENKLPPGVVYRPVLEEEIGTYPNVTRRFVPRPCMQCERPPCVPVCPVNATYTNEEGIVEVNYNQCIGCRACLTACPYGARTSDFGYTYAEGMPNADGLILGRDSAEAYERAASYEYSQPWPRPPGKRQSPMGNARKCHFCQHRLKQGMLPECVTTCIGRATLFGDANDPDSVVAQLIKLPNVMRLKEELGTQPRVYYIV
ncbi:MAG: 4Fe-4S dicluster domain-containing protein [Anaerolineae bacterium]|jgi:Fe-S-cluster-containing dehydrogenase component|nr:4Fe-4S dicluster domain-containing protein [Anaerolineae bacterium]